MGLSVVDDFKREENLFLSTPKPEFGRLCHGLQPSISGSGKLCDRCEMERILSMSSSKCIESKCIDLFKGIMIIIFRGLIDMPNVKVISRSQLFPCCRGG